MGLGRSDVAAECAGRAAELADQEADRQQAQQLAGRAAAAPAAGPPPGAGGEATGGEATGGEATGAWRVARTAGRGREMVASAPAAPGSVLAREAPLLSAPAKRRWRDRCQGCAGSLAEGYAVPCGRCPLHRFCSLRCRDELRGALGPGLAGECASPFLALLPEQAALAGRLAWAAARGGAPGAAARGLASALRATGAPTLAELVALALVAAACYGAPPAGALAMLGRVVCNAVGVPGEAGERAALAVYPGVSMCNHACRPAAALAFPRMAAPPDRADPARSLREVGDAAGALPAGGALARLLGGAGAAAGAAAPPCSEAALVVGGAALGEGDRVTISYGPAEGGMDRAQRRRVLLDQYGFDCDCAACRG